MTELADKLEALAVEAEAKSGGMDEYQRGKAEGLRQAAEIVRNANIVYWEDPDEEKEAKDGD